MTFEELKSKLEKDKQGNYIVDKDYEVDFKTGDTFLLKVGRNYRKIKIQ